MKAANLEKAAKFGYYQLSNLPEHVKKDSWFADKHLNPENWVDDSVIPEFFKNSSFEVGVFGNVRTQYKNFSNEIELYYVDGFYTLLFSDSIDFPLILKRDWKTKKYYLFPIYELINRLQVNTNYQQRAKYLEELKEPNNIGVFTDKKIADWVDYCSAYIHKLEACSSDITNKKNENQMYIDSVIESMQGAKIYKHENYTTIENSLFRIEFQILDNGEYLSNKIEFRGKVEDVIKLNNK